jgi:hypothetical protein
MEGDGRGLFEGAAQQQPVIWKRVSSNTSPKHFVSAIFLAYLS